MNQHERLRGNPTYESWLAMRRRCLCPTNRVYPRYGGRGIAICEQWSKFANFLADMGERPSGLSLDRINNDGNYEPGNCRWTTMAQQNRNTRQNRFLEHDDVRLCINDWAQKLGIDKRTLGDRIRRGWPVSRALTTPPIVTGARAALAKARE